MLYPTSRDLARVHWENPNGMRLYLMWENDFFPLVFGSLEGDSALPT
jgi:hypothetical protein